LKLMQYQKIASYIRNNLRSIRLIIRAMYENLNINARAQSEISNYVSTWNHLSITISIPPNPGHVAHLSMRSAYNTTSTMGTPK
jgi:hypothetical protein